MVDISLQKEDVSAYHSHEVCKTTFYFLYGVGRRSIMALKDSYLANGLETRVHGNREDLPYNQMTHIAISHIVKFLKNYTEENAILLPGQIHDYKRGNTKLLSSSRSKKVFCMNTHLEQLLFSTASIINNFA